MKVLPFRTDPPVVSAILFHLDLPHKDGSSLSVDAADDALHSSETPWINGWVLQLASGDDGIHGDDEMVIHDGDISVCAPWEAGPTCGLSIFLRRLRHGSDVESDSPDAALMTDIPSRLDAALADRYRIERKLGEGGMATVYLAEDLRHKRRVAVKVLRPEIASALGPERFLREIEITARLTHPHILPLLDSGEAEGHLFYVMPYVDGETLRDRLDRERELPVDESLGVIEALASALDYAHRQGIVHRDIKPSNVLFQDRQPLIADFGIAVAISAAAGERLTATGLSIGTPQYMSPEQAAADRPLSMAAPTCTPSPASCTRCSLVSPRLRQAPREPF